MPASAERETSIKAFDPKAKYQSSTLFEYALRAVCTLLDDELSFSASVLCISPSHPTLEQLVAQAKEILAKIYTGIEHADRALCLFVAPLAEERLKAHGSAHVQALLQAVQQLAEQQCVEFFREQQQKIQDSSAEHAKDCDVLPVVRAFCAFYASVDTHILRSRPPPSLCNHLQQLFQCICDRLESLSVLPTAFHSSDFMRQQLARSQLAPFAEAQFQKSLRKITRSAIASIVPGCFAFFAAFAPFEHSQPPPGHPMLHPKSLSEAFSRSRVSKEAAKGLRETVQRLYAAAAGSVWRSLCADFEQLHAEWAQALQRLFPDGSVCLPLDSVFLSAIEN